MKMRIGCATMAAAMALAMSGRATALGPTSRPADGASLGGENAALRHRLDDMQRQVDDLKRAVTPATPTPVPPAPASPPATFTSLLLDNKPVELPGDVTAGYKDGFYLQQGDTFQVKADALIDVQYAFAQATNKTNLGDTPIGHQGRADASGFTLFNGQASLQGYLFKHGQSEGFFKAMGNFGTLAAPTGATGGSFLVNELYAGYAVDDGLRFRVGSVVVPFTPLRSITDYGGLTFPYVSDTVVPFVPGFALGADVLGSLAKDTVSYDVLVCNGTNSQNLTNSTSPLSGRDNRLAFYTREQVAGSGKVSEFQDESDTEDHQTFSWVAGGGLGYETQATAGTTFPGPQTSLGITGLSSATGEGFADRYNLNGEVERYVADLRAKFHGLSLFGEGYYQHISRAGSPDIVPGYTKNGIGQVGFFGQAGYFVVPKHLEVAGRFGQLYTDGLPHEMDEWSFGVNYYLFGQNLKVQAAETYIPRQAALTSTYGSLTNTSDWITQVQAQLKF